MRATMVSKPRLDFSRLGIALVCSLLGTGLVWAQCSDGCYLTFYYNDWDNDWETKGEKMCITYSSPAAGLKDFAPLVCKATKWVRRAPSTRLRYCGKVGALGANMKGNAGNFVEEYLNTQCAPAGS